MDKFSASLKGGKAPPGRPACGLRHRLEVSGGAFPYVCCDSRDCLYCEVIAGIKYCTYRREAGKSDNDISGGKDE
jgi:hypothetical protein